MSEPMDRHFSVLDHLTDQYLEQEYHEEMARERDIEIIREDRMEGLPAIRDNGWGKPENRGLRIRLAYRTRRNKLDALTVFKKRIKGMDAEKLKDKFLNAMEEIKNINTTQAWRKLHKISVIKIVSEIALGRGFNVKMKDDKNEVNYDY